MFEDSGNIQPVVVESEAKVLRRRSTRSRLKSDALLLQPSWPIRQGEMDIHVLLRVEVDGLGSCSRSFMVCEA